MIYLNLTPYEATPEQRAAGVVDLPEPFRSQVTKLVTCDRRIEKEDVWTRASLLSSLVRLYLRRSGLRPDDVFDPNIGALLDCPEWLVGPATFTLHKWALVSCYFPFGEWEVVEARSRSGTVRRITVFKHKGFIPVVPGCPDCLE